MKRLLRLTFGLLAAAIVTLGFTAAAGAQSTSSCYSAATCSPSLTLSSFSVPSGGTATVSGSGFLPNKTVTVTVASDPYVAGTPVTDANGAFSLTFTAPTEAGEHTITVTDGTNTRVLAFTVTAAGAVTSSGTLPYTGSNSSLPVAQIGAGLLAAGAVIVLTVRKRQQHTAAVKVDA